MAVSIPPLTKEQELDSIMENDQLMEFFETNLPNQEDFEPDTIILEREAEAVEVFSKNFPDFWSQA